MGRAVTSSQETDGLTYAFQYAYNEAGGLETMTYPSNRVVSYCSDAAGRISGVTGYASGIQYAPHGAASQMTLGNGVLETTTWEPKRMQPTAISAVKGGNTLLGLTLGYGTASNNGNVLSQQIQPLNVTQSYGYDSLNRINQFTEAGLSRGYGLDQYGNRWVPANTGLPLSPLTPITQSWFQASTNRLTSTGYDTSGNQTQVNPFAVVYDGENRQMNATNSVAGIVITYRYDGEGRRVKKAANGLTTTYVYDAFGKLAAEYGTGTVSGTRYVTADHLGSTRLVTDAGGNLVRRYDYLPYGEEMFATIGPRTEAMGYLALGATDNLPQKFTGKERDAETGLDYFGARYYGGAMGRFTTPDPLMASAEASDPQTWNRYSYALNNPLKFVDPDGLEVPDSCVKDQNCTIVVKLNVVYDQTMNRGRGPTQQQRTKF